ncbi:spore gernimation protein [Bacillus sp. HMF5848]|uniref:spore germination protein GerPC n=1 Tax=Bacillus sp. HMF5848 TaxID=2495421 RepID=UPI000F787D34|nr:spore germination protein GerPC [Bacillus sp. HMF5848]RSK26363.1 spore gernimation protein [Bacillus sp. HMF5848]
MITLHISPEWYQYLMQLHSYTKKQNKRIAQLEDLVEELREQMKEIKQRPSMQVEKLEYKFDQLKVERLDGTLNIGLNPNDTEKIEDFAVQQTNSLKKAPAAIDPDLKNRVMQAAEQYIANDGVHKLKELESSHGHEFDSAFRAFIIQDMKAQLPTRVNYYLNQLQSSDLNNPDKVSQLEKAIIAKIKNDIDTSLQAFIQNYPKKGSNEEV